MDLKKIILLICAGVGLWFAWNAANNRDLTEEHINALYSEAWRAFINNDGKAYCALFSDDLSGSSETRMQGMPVERKTITRKDACAAVDDLYTLKREMEEKAKITLYFNYDLRVDSVTLAPDKKSATVTSHDEIRIGTERGALLTFQTQTTDKLRRHSGKIQIFQSDSRTKTFPGGSR
jgi:hypothetical protein